MFFTLLFHYIYLFVINTKVFLFLIKIKVLMQNRRCDVKHTTYQMMKIVISNSLAKCLNVTGKKGNKLCFLDMELYNIIVGKFI